MLESSRLLETLHECGEVSPLRVRFYQNMNVIGHEDVGENCELKQTGVMKKLLDNSTHQHWIRKEGATKASAGSQEISLVATV